MLLVAPPSEPHGFQVPMLRHAPLHRLPEQQHWTWGHVLHQEFCRTEQNRRQLQLFLGGINFHSDKTGHVHSEVPLFAFWQRRCGSEPSPPKKTFQSITYEYYEFLKADQVLFIIFLYSTLPQGIDRFIDRQFLIRISLYDTLTFCVYFPILSTLCYEWALSSLLCCFVFYNDTTDPLRNCNFLLIFMNFMCLWSVSETLSAYRWHTE